MVKSAVLDTAMMGVAQQIIGSVGIHLSGNQVLQNFELRGHDCPAAENFSQKTRESTAVRFVQNTREKLVVFHQFVGQRLVAAAFVDHALRRMRKTCVTDVMEQTRQTD